MKPTKIYTLEEFNEIFIAHQREKYKTIKLNKVAGFSLWKTKTKSEVVSKSDANNIPYIERTVLSQKQSFDINQFNKLIVAYLKMFTPTLKCDVTNTKGNYIPNVGFVQNYADRGRADVTAQYNDFELCVETKKKYESQLDSQKKFEGMANQQSFRKYIITRSFEDFQEKINNIFKFW